MALVLNTVPTFDLDLDQPGEERWKHIFDSYSVKDREELVRNARALLAPFSTYISVANLALSLVPASMMMYVNELVFISNYCGLSYAELLFLQLIYESSSACTTIIWKDEEGTNHFFRTMDWPMEFLKKWTIRLRYFKDGRLLSEAVTWVGLVGVFTIKSHVDNYVIAVNYRRTKETLSLNDLMKNATRLISLHFPIAYLVRNTVNTKSNYEEAKKILLETSLISPCYFTIYHTTEIEKSCIITRDATASSIPNIRFWKAESSLCQTNCDWRNTTPDILHSVKRYEKVNEILETNPRTGKSFLTFPILNEEGIYAYTIDGKNENVMIL